MSDVIVLTFSPGANAQLVHRDNRPGVDLHHVRIDAEFLERLLQHGRHFADERFLTFGVAVLGFFQAVPRRQVVLAQFLRRRRRRGDLPRLETVRELDDDLLARRLGRRGSLNRFRRDLRHRFDDRRRQLHHRRRDDGRRGRDRVARVVERGVGGGGVVVVVQHHVVRLATRQVLEPKQHRQLVVFLFLVRLHHALHADALGPARLPSERRQLELRRGGQLDGRQRRCDRRRRGHEQIIRRQQQPDQQRRGEDQSRARRAAVPTAGSAPRRYPAPRPGPREIRSRCPATGGAPPPRTPP